MLYCIYLLHSGFLSALLAFLVWSLPAAIATYALSLGIATITPPLHPAVHALLSGLNAAVVGIILLAAVQLSQKAITDRPTRVLVFLGATAGMLYNALWYFPILMFAAGVAIVVWDFRWLHPLGRWVRGVYTRVRKGKAENEGQDAGVELGERREENGETREDSTQLPEPGSAKEGDDGLTNRGTTASPPTASAKASPPSSALPVTSQDSEAEAEAEAARIIPESRRINVSWQAGTAIIIGFLISFIIIMVLRGTLTPPPLLYRLFANLYLAGTIIFGGGPVVIPLLREYVVAEGWVSPRDFLIGLAIIQAFPGPNFNFAVYLGSLTASNAGYPSAAGAVIGYLGIFVPGLATVHGEMGLWSALRGKRWVRSALRGINAAAVGLIYTAVYRLWQIGFVDVGSESGQSLGNDPWWVVVTATSYVGGRWFALNPPLAIILGAIMGLIRYGVVRR
jgi:chromate transport protein ChrA